MPRCLIAVACLVILAAGCSTSSSSHASDKVRVVFSVTVPDDTDAKATLYVSGNLPEVGLWNGHGAALARQSNGTYSAALLLPKGKTLEYKITRGAWETVEKSATGDEISNRTMTLDVDRTVAIKVESWRKANETTRPTAPTTVGDVRYHSNFHSNVLGNERKLIVWLPPGYEKDSTQRYPVLYMHDGQNLFDAATSYAGEWRADETATKLIEAKRIVPLIIVGIENAGADRTFEYTPTSAEVLDEFDQKTIEGGGGEQYEQFLIREVKPFIDRTYRTLPDREHTAVAGSSLGGLISLHIAWKHNDVFGLCAAISPSLWWDKRKMLITFELDNRWMKRERIWVDMGTNEGYLEDQPKYLGASREMHAIMARAGLKEGTDYAYREIEGAEHNEKAWSARFDQVLLFLFGTH